MFLYLLVGLLVLLVVLPLIGVALWALVSLVVTGLIIGALGRLVVPGTQAIGLLATMLIGLAGSLLGTFLAAVLHTGDVVTLLLQVASAAILVAAYASRGSRSLRSSGRGQLAGRRF